MKEEKDVKKEIKPSSVAFVDIRDTYKETIKNLNINKLSFGTVFVVEIPNPSKLNLQNKRTDIHGKTLREYVQKDKSDKTEYVVFHNEKRIDDIELQKSIIVKEHDSIIYFPKQEGVISAIAGGVLQAFLTGIGTAGGLIASYGAYAGLVGLSYVLAVGLVVGGMMLINSMLAPEIPDLSMEDNLKESKTYSWDGISTNRDINSPIPTLYGTHVIGGTEINKYQYYKDTDDWLALQIGLCYGEIEEISSSDIYVNDQAYNNFIKSSNDGRFEFTEGTFNQKILEGFDDTVFNNGNVVKKLTYQEPYIFESSSNDIDKFRLNFEFPHGLQKLDSKKGGRYGITVSYSVAYRLKGTTTWNYFINPVYEKQYSILEKRYTEVFVPYAWNPNKGYSKTVKEWVWTPWTKYNSNNSDLQEDIIGRGGESYLQKKGRIRYRNKNIGNSNVLKYTGNSTNPLKFKVDSSDLGIELEKGKYEFRVERLTYEPSSTDKYGNEGGSRILWRSEFKLSFLEEINTTDLNYGGIAQLGLNLKATEHVQGQQPNITTKVTRKPLKIYTNDDYSFFIEGRSNNPAWVCYDILTNPFYGAKIKPSQLDLDRFQDWANFCDLEHIREETIISGDEPYTSERLTYSSVERSLKVYKSEILQEISSIELETYNKGLSQIILTKDDGDTFTFNDLVHILESSDSGGDFYVFVFSDYNENFTESNITNVNFLLDFASIDFITLTDLGHPLQLNFNGLFDTLTNPWDACQKVAKLGRGQILLRGNKYSCTFDGIQPITNMFNVSDIKKETFQVSYTPQTDLTTELEIQYPDEEIRNELNAITILDKDLSDTRLEPKKATVNAVGVTTKAEAIVFGRYMLATTKFQRRTVTWESDIKGITCEVGDIVAIQNDTPLWGNGGKIQDVTSSEITLEEPVSLTSDKVYVLKVQSFDGTFTDYYLDNLDLTNTLSLPLPDTSNIIQGNSYIFGENNNEALLVRLIEVKREQNTLGTKFIGVDYNPSILDFNFNNDVLTTIEPDLDVTNELLTFDITEEVSIDSSGKANINLAFSWTAVNTSNYDLYAIPDFVDPDNILTQEPLPNIPENRIYLAKDVKGNSYKAENTGFIENRYRLFIQERGNPSNFIEKIYIVNGKEIRPPDVDIFTVSGRPNEVKTLTFGILSPPPDLAGYIIKYQVGNSYNWNTATPIHEGILTTSPYKADITKVQGEYNLLIKAIDGYGNESLNPRFIKFNQGETLIDNLIYEKDFHAEAFIGEIFGGTVQPNNDLLGDPSNDLFYFRDNSDLLYDRNDGEHFYQGLFEPMYFIGEFIPDGSGTALIEYTGTGSPKIEYREYYPKLMYQNDDFLMYSNNESLMYEESEWNLYSGGFPVKSFKRYQLKVSYIESTVRPSITSLKVKVDVEDIDESFEDVVIEVGGTTIYTKYINNLKNVVSTLQSSFGSTANRVEVINKTLTSATLKCFDINDVEVQGLVDIRFKGYINE